MLTRTPIAANLSILIALAVTGCSTQGEKMVESYSDTKDTIAEAQAQVDATLAAMASLRVVSADTIGGAFGEYKEQVEELEEQGIAAKERAAVMKSDAEEHIKKWQKEQAEITDPQIKATLESRQKAVRSNFSLLKMYADDVRKKYEPFLKRNKEMVQALSIDLSPKAVASFGQAMDQIMADGMALKERMTAMQRGLQNISEGESPIGR